ncbi:hypothetical protein FQR65_LT09020 [Abscondita terminalis]|nr:hypothetical protein FQR65_LT09020 [Abscondita terminalis]
MESEKEKKVSNVSDYENVSQSATERSHPQQVEKKLPYPKSVFFIVSNEFCERFSYYGMRTILSLYLNDILLYSQSDSTIIYHVFTMMVYFFPLLGAILSDSLLGKFRTILYVSCLYALGNIVLALAATPPLNLPERPISLLGLLLIALGTGGIKPCVAAFGGDQFILPQQELQLATFFSLFYFSINSGSLISTFITPIIREDVKCFGMDSCYSLAFGIPGILMVVSIIVFALGKPLYKIKEPAGNMLVQVSKCIGNAISTKFKSKGVKKDNWLDYAEEKHGAKLVSEVKSLIRVLVLFIPLPVFWALFDQQGSGWTFMARRMNGDIGGFTLLPDQMQVINPLLILLFIPLFQYVIYPIMNKCNVLTTPLKRLVAGGALAAISFIISATISLALERTFPILPTEGNGQLRIYNALDGNLTLDVKDFGGKLEIPALSNYSNIDIAVSGTKDIPYSYTFNGNAYNGAFEVDEQKSVAYLFKETGKLAIKLEDDVDKTSNGNPKFRLLLNSYKEIDIEFVDSDGEIKLSLNTSDTDFKDLKPDIYELRFGKGLVTASIEMKLGAVYTVVGIVKIDSVELNTITVTSPNSISILFLIPQYIVITAAEIMFSITGLEFAYSQAPTSMKSVLQACWLLTTAFGNLIVVIIESAEPFHEQSKTFFLYGGLMLADMIVFTFMAMRYEYVKKEGTEDEKEKEIKEKENGGTDYYNAKVPEKQNGISNTAFTASDEKGLKI